MLFFGFKNCFCFFFFFLNVDVGMFDGCPLVPNIFSGHVLKAWGLYHLWLAFVTFILKYAEGIGKIV